MLLQQQILASGAELGKDPSRPASPVCMVVFFLRSFLEVGGLFHSFTKGENMGG